MKWSALLDDFRTFLVSPELPLVDLSLPNAQDLEGDKVEGWRSECSPDSKIGTRTTPIESGPDAKDTATIVDPATHEGKNLEQNSLPDPRNHLVEPFWVSEYLMSRYDREQLYEYVWTMPLKTLAKKFDVSGSTLGSVCKRLHVPLPGVGYWNKSAAGKPVPPRPPLPTVQVGRKVGHHARREMSRWHTVAVSRGLMSRYNREKLYDQVWKTPLVKLAKEWGVTDNTLGGVCRRLQVPTPGLGYWNKKAAGKQIEPPPPLPVIDIQLKHPNVLLIASKPAKPSDLPLDSLPLGGSGVGNSTTNSPKREAVGMDALGEVAHLKYPGAARSFDQAKVSLEGEKIEPSGILTFVKTPQVSPMLMGRYNREELYEKVWATTMQKLAKEYGVSGVALGKTCRKLQIPVPGKGYWNKRAANQPVQPRPSLPTIQASDATPDPAGSKDGDQSAPDRSSRKVLLASQRIRKNSVKGSAATETIRVRNRVEQIPPPQIVRYDREELYERAWAMPVVKVACLYGVSNVAIAKACKRLQVPVPGLGYWAKKAANQPVKYRPPLPRLPA
jgi:hypothetical protein